MSTILDRDQWLAKLVQIAANLGSEGPSIRLCVIGSVACVFGGMAARTRLADPDEPSQKGQK